VVFAFACAHPAPRALPACASAEHAQMQRGSWQGALFRRAQGAWEVIALGGGDLR